MTINDKAGEFLKKHEGEIKYKEKYNIDRIQEEKEKDKIERKDKSS